MKYEEYKDSGMSWIGLVPIQWKKSRLKFLFSHSNAGVWGEEEKGDENDIVCFRVADFDYQKGYLGFDKLTMRNITPKEIQGRLLAEGSLLIEKSGGGDVTPVGRVVRFNYDDKATCSNFVHFVTVDELHNSDFLYYYFYAMYANKENLLYFNQTTGIQNLKVGEYLGQSIFIPSFQEQAAIASYLDEKCGKINNAIDTQKKKIELLNELKQTIITNAVTKGLNPAAPMKDSGVEWIGKIPEHWEVRRLKYNSKFINGYAFKSDTFSDDGEYPVIRIGDICNDGISYENIVYVAKETELDNYRVLENDILIAMSGATVGKVGLCNSNDVGYINQRVGIIRSEIHRLIWYNLLSPKFLEYIYLMSDGSAQPNISSKGIGDYYVAIPPYNEQKEIIEHLSEEVFKIDSQISKANRRIELLNELKQSIITEVVTGKIKLC